MPISEDQLESFDLKVNFLDYEEESPKGKKIKFCWEIFG
jgi:hypothetical protein